MIFRMAWTQAPHDLMPFHCHGDRELGESADVDLACARWLERLASASSLKPELLCIKVPSEARPWLLVFFFFKGAMWDF